MTNIPIRFEDAQRFACTASIVIEGLPGKGKSGLALALGYVLAGKDWSKVYHIDTENKSANLFAGIGCSLGNTFGKFKVAQITPDIGFAPTTYLAFREVAIKAGAKVIIKDSISHAWQYKGGVLDLVTQAKSKDARYAKDNYAAWGDPKVVKEKNELLQLIRHPSVHVICTVRVKEKMEYVDGLDGKKDLKSLGEQQIQQADLKYEPDLVLHMLTPGKNKNGTIKHPIVKVVKSRYAIFDEDTEYEFTPELMQQLKIYLEDGADPAKLLEKQRQDYIQAVTEYLDKNPNARPIWQVLKSDAGHKDTKLQDLPLDVLKPLYINLIN